MFAGCGHAVDASKFNAIEWEKQIKDPTLSEKEFTRLCALNAAAETKGGKVQVVNDQQFKIQLPNGNLLFVYLGNVWKETEKSPANRAEAFNRYLAMIKGENSSSAAKINSIIAEVRNAQVVEMTKKYGPGNSSKTIFEPFVADLQIMYSIDEGDHHRFLTEDDLKDQDLSLSTLRNLAATHLARLSPQVTSNASLPIFSVKADGKRQSTLLLCDALWEQESKKVEGNIIVAVLPKDELVYTDSKSKNGVAALRELVTKTEKIAFVSVNGTLIVRRNGHWEKFTD